MALVHAGVVDIRVVDLERPEGRASHVCGPEALVARVRHQLRGQHVQVVATDPRYLQAGKDYLSYVQETFWP